MSNGIIDYIRVREGNWSGYVHTDFQDIAITELVEPDRSGSKDTHFEKVQSSEAAEVYRYCIEVHARPVLLYLKRHLDRSVLDRIKHLFRPSRAERAFYAGLLLQKYNFDSPQIAAFLRKKKGLAASEDILITRGISNTSSLTAVLTTNTLNGGQLDRRTRRRLFLQLGKTIGRMHATGICHGDLRAGNVLVRAEAGGFTFTLIDNERTRKYRSLLPHLRRKNLVQLNMLREGVSVTDRMRFWKHYCQAAGIDRLRAQSLLRAVLRRTGVRLKKRAKTHLGFSDVTLPAQRMALKTKTAVYKGFYLKAFCSKEDAASLLGQIEGLMETGVVLKDDTATRVVRCTYNGWDIVVKRYNHQGLWHSLRHTIKGSRAQKNWTLGHLLTKANIASPDPLAMIEERKFGLIQQSYIITSYVEGPLLHDVMNGGGYSPQEQQTIMEKAEKLIEKLRHHQMTHSDMKPANMIICQGEPVLIDLDSMQQHHSRFFFEYRYRKMVRYFHQRLHGKVKR